MHRAHDADDDAVCRLDWWESICGREDAWTGRALTSKAQKIGISAVRNLGGALAEVQAVLAAGLLAAPVESVDRERSEERRAWAFFAKFAGHSEAVPIAEQLLLLHCTRTLSLPPPSGRAQISSQKGQPIAPHPTRSLHFAQSSKYSFRLVAISCLSAAARAFVFVSLGHHTFSAPPSRLLPAQVRSSFARHVGSSHERQGAV